MSKKKRRDPLLIAFPHQSKPIENVQYVAVCTTSGCGFTGLPMTGADLALLRIANALCMIHCPRCEGTAWHYQLVEEEPQ